MTQQFYPYVPGPADARLCDAAYCIHFALWRDTRYDALWCEYHATIELVAPDPVQCQLCLQWFNLSHIQSCVCVGCHARMALDEVR